MKEITTLLLLALSLVANAQNLKVSVVNDSSQPMPYTYIYHRGKPIAVTDQQGISIIAADQLSLGDTISAIVIGTQPVKIVFDKALSDRGEYCFHVSDIHRSLASDEVTVTTDIRKLYLKHTKLLPPVIYNCELTSGFIITQSQDGSLKYAARGQSQAAHKPYSKFYPPWSKGHFHLPIEITTSDDTTNYQYFIDQNIRYALQSANFAITVSDPAYYKGQEVNYAYLSKTNGSRIFRISNTYNDPNGNPGVSMQALIYVDQATQLITRIDLQIANVTLGRTIESSVNYVRLAEKKPAMAVILQPTSINYTLTQVDGQVIEVVLDNCVIQHNKTMYRER